MRWAAKRDANEGAIIQALNLAGWVCFRISDAGFPDLLIVRHGLVRLVEVKAKGGSLTPAQRMLHLKFQAAGLLVHVVRSPEEAVAAVRGVA